ncbi:MAG: membrane integrity-associated transporter subunit PqiC [Myxococcota bacterium]
MNAKASGSRNRKKRILRSAALLIVLFFGAACLGRSPEVKRYVLGVDALPERGERAPGVAVMIESVRLPAHLDRSQIARRGRGGQVQLDEFHRWLGGFGKNVIRGVEAGLARQLGSIRVVAHPSRAPFPFDYRVRLHVDDLILDANGALVAQIRWALVPSQGEAQLFVLDERIESVGRSADALVRAHEEVLADLSTRIAEAIETHGQSF